MSDSYTTRRDNFFAQKIILQETGLFDTPKILYPWDIIRLSGTGYYLGIQYSFTKKTWYNCWSKERDENDKGYGVYKEISFQEVFDNSPVEVKKRMIQHLDLLK